jgi:hypothetical protein
MLGLTTSGELGVINRFSSLFYNFFGLFLPQNVFPTVINLSRYMDDKYPVGGGGTFFIYFFVWLGYVGVILSGILLKYALTVRKSTRTGLSIYFLPIVLITLPRWSMYSPLNLFKFLFVYFLLLWLLRSLNILKNEKIITN